MSFVFNMFSQGDGVMVWRSECHMARQHSTSRGWGGPGQRTTHITYPNLCFLFAWHRYQTWQMAKLRAIRTYWLAALLTFGPALSMVWRLTVYFRACWDASWFRIYWIFILKVNLTLPNTNTYTSLHGWLFLTSKPSTSNLPAKIIDCHIYAEIRHRMYRLPQAGKLTNEQLEQFLLPHQYIPCPVTPGLWRDTTGDLKVHSCSNYPRSQYHICSFRP